MFTSCESIDSKRNRVIGRGVYAVGDSIKVGRFDLAKKYNNELKQYFPPPKKRIKVKKISVPTEKGEETKIIVPQNLEGMDVVVVSSEKWKTLLSENPELIKQLEQEEKNVTKLRSNIEKLKRDEAKARQKAKKRGIFAFFGWIFGLIPFLSVIGVGGLIALAVFNPPLALSILSTIASIGGRIVKAFFSWIETVIGFIQDIRIKNKEEP